METGERIELISPGEEALILPTRDGNKVTLFHSFIFPSSFDPTYKGWKPKRSCENQIYQKALILPTRDGNINVGDVSAGHYVAL